MCYRLSNSFFQLWHSHFISSSRSDCCQWCGEVSTPRKLPLPPLLSLSLRAGWAAPAGWWSRRWTSEAAASARHPDTCAGEHRITSLHVLLAGIRCSRLIAICKTSVLTRTSYSDMKCSKMLLFTQMFDASWFTVVPLWNRLFRREKLCVNEKEKKNLFALVCFPSL